MSMTTEKIILFINRDTPFREQTGAILEKAGYGVRTAVEMREALSILSSGSVGLVICDKQLRDISGLDLLHFIKKDPLRESIPFMFLVSSKEQGGAFNAFQLGAVDYFVYPLEPEALIDRVDEVFSSTGLKPSPSDKGVASDAIAAQAAIPDPMSVSGVVIDVSRDGIIWLPGRIVSFGRQRLFLETALFGKPGVSLMARIKLSEGTFVLNGFIKNITYDDFQKPASIEMSTQEEDGWRRIHAYLLERAQQAGEPASPSEELAKTILLTPLQSEKTLYRTGPFKPTVKKSSYDQRFYHSIIGKQLDNYRAITLIGAGSMGGVMQGWDVALEREVALKVISYELSSKEKFREMFVKEARVVSRLNHLNIAQIYYIGTSSDILYYAMEFVDGQTLKDLLAKQGNLNTLKGLEYLITVCEALYFVHQNSIIHRDIKPANIMLNHAGMIKIVDFGVAITTGAGKKSEKPQVIGSPMYMSPEQVAGLAVDYRSDIYSVGATFYHIFTGSPPFEAEDYKQVMSHHINKPLPPMRGKNPHIPTALAKTIEKMMSKDPFDRQTDFQVVADEIKALHANILERKRQPSMRTRP
jgi:DNA-binding response OmpR family regulator/predicted Ser/Thr protein kinase